MDWTKAPNLTDPITSKNFYRRAHWWATRQKEKPIAPDQWPVIQPGMPEWNDWASYFRGLGWIPSAFQSCIDRHAKGISTAAFTVPTLKPGEFDAYGWAHRREAPPPVIKKLLAKPTLEMLKRKHGEFWGIDQHGDGKRVPQFAAMTKEMALARLRAEFGSEIVDAVPDAPPRRDDMKPLQ